MKFEKITAGMTLYDVHSHRMGNTKMKTIGVWSVNVIEVDAENRKARCSWNGNQATWLYESSLAKLKGVKPILVSTAMGGKRRPTLKERQDIMAARKEKAE